MTWTRDKSAGSTRGSLPVAAYESEVVSLCGSHEAVVITGDAGCGKSTQVPQFVLDGVAGAKIACSQPRRLSAMAVAERVAAERGGTVGGEVGYHVRFEASFSDETRLVFATPGVLLRKLGSGPPGRKKRSFGRTLTWRHSGRLRR